MAEKKSARTILTTMATPVDDQSSVSTKLTANKKVPTSTDSAFTKSCLFCQGEHTLTKVWHSVAHCKKHLKISSQGETRFSEQVGPASHGDRSASPRARGAGSARADGGAGRAGVRAECAHLTLFDVT